MSENLVEYKEKAGACAECGNSPVRHTPLWWHATLSVYFSMMGRDFLGNGSGIFGGIDKYVRMLSETIDEVMFRSFALVGLVQYQREVSKAATYRSQVIWEEAVRRHIPMEQVIFFGKYIDNYRAQIRGRWRYFTSIPIPSSLPQTAYFWIDDKYLLKRALQTLGVAVPIYASVTTAKEARAAFDWMGGTVIVKPRSGSRGRHTTTFVRSYEELDRAFAIAQQLCRFVSIERHLEGSVCRGTVIGGKLAGFFSAAAPEIVGDGRSTIEQLIAAKNSAKPDRVQDIVMRDEHYAFLARQGFTGETVLRAGQMVTLSHRTGRLFGGETRELLDTVHPTLRDGLERAAQGLCVPVVGFDLIIRDPESDPLTQEWGIIEANSLPFIDLHYLPLHGAPSNPAAQVWDLWD